MAISIEELHEDHRHHRIVTYTIIAFLVFLSLCTIFIIGSLKDKEQAYSDSTEASVRRFPNRISRIPTPTTRPSQDLKFAVQAPFYNEYKNHLKSGDWVAVNVLRNSSTEAITQDHPKYKKAVNDLGSVDSQSGIQKIMVFSSVQDIKIMASLLPVDVSMVAYNFEPAMTPQGELNDMVAAVSQFADAVHAVGKKMMFIPTYDKWDVLQTNNQLETVLNKIDALDFQGQRIVAYRSIDDLKSSITQKYTLFKKIKPNLIFMVQMFCPTNTSSQIVSAFQAISGSYDVAGIINLTPDSNCVNTVNTALTGLGR